MKELEHDILQTVGHILITLGELEGQMWLVGNETHGTMIRLSALQQESLRRPLAKAASLLEECHRTILRHQDRDKLTKRLLELLSMCDPMHNNRRNAHEYPIHIEGVAPEVTELCNVLCELQDSFNTEG